MKTMFYKKYYLRENRQQQGIFAIIKGLPTKLEQKIRNETLNSSECFIFSKSLFNNSLRKTHRIF